MAPLASPTELETYAGLGLPADRANLLLDQASGLVRDYCGWHIAPQVIEDVTVDGSGAAIQGLPTLYLTDVTAVSEDGDSVDLADVTWSQVGHLHRAKPWTCAFRAVTASIVHGYTVTPPAVQAVVCAIASRAAASPTGVISESTGPFSVRFSQTAPGQAGGVVLTSIEQDVLERYRIPNRS